MRTAVLLLNFGEPERPTMDEVVPFLERIFATNASLMGPASPEEVRRRSRELALERAPGLVEEYQAIGGSPLAAQAREQAELLEAELRRRGHDAFVLLGYQFTEPSVGDVVAQAREAGADKLVGLPVYPLCGPSTTVAALAKLDREVERLGWDVTVEQVTGWHRHPEYVRLRARAVRRLLDEHNLSLLDRGTRLVFSAHGTPVKYLEEGSRYDLYVRDFCDALARELGVADYALGWQNHGNRPGVRWTEPSIDEVVGAVEAERIVVDPVSFMHEQSETLAELDHELREEAEARGLGFHRVRIPHADPAFIGVLADLVEPFTGDSAPLSGDAAHDVAGLPLRQCMCKPTAGAYCLNAALTAPRRG